MKTFRLLSLLLLLAAPAFSQVVYDAATYGHCDGGVTNVCTASDTTLTFAHTTGSGSNRAAAAIVCNAGPSANVAPAISSITYAGVSLTSTLNRFDTTGTNYFCTLYQLPAGTQPTTGANNVVVVLASGEPSSFYQLQVTFFTASGVDQTTTFSVTGSNFNSSGTTSSTLTLGASGANDLVISAACAGSDFSSTSAPATQRTIGSGAGQGACGSMLGSTAPGNTTALSDTISATDSWIKIGAAFKAAGAATPAPTKRPMVF